MDLKANTAVDVLIGPFLDSTDGNTTEDALTLNQADVKLSKNGQTLAQKSDVTACAFDDDGYYNCELDSTDVNTEGSLVLIVHKTGALAVRHEYNIMSEAAWDSVYGAKDTGYMDVNIKAVSEDTTAADNLESACDNYSATRGLSGTALPAVAADGAGGLPISDAGGLALDTILDVAISTRGTADPGDLMGLANDAITSAKYDETTAFPVASADTGATQIARTGADADTLETLSDQIDGTSTHSAADVVDNWETQSQANPTGFHVNIQEIKDTAQTANDNGADLNSLISRLGVPSDLGSGSNVADNLVDIESQTDDIGVAGAGLSALPNQTMNITGNITGNLIGDVTGNVDGTVTGKTPSEAGDDMNLANDAIKATKYDETTAFPVKSDDSGATQIFRTGADADTGETLSDQIDAVPTVGDIRTEMEGDGYDLSALVEGLINKQIIKESNGDTEVFNDAGSSQGTVSTAFSTDGTYTTRLKIRI